MIFETKPIQPIALKVFKITWHYRMTYENVVGLLPGTVWEREYLFGFDHDIQRSLVV